MDVAPYQEILQFRFSKTGIFFSGNCKIFGQKILKMREFWRYFFHVGEIIGMRESPGGIVDSYAICLVVISLYGGILYGAVVCTVFSILPKIPLYTTVQCTAVPVV